MKILTTLLSIVLIFLVLMDAFESMVLPRRVIHPFRFTRFFFRNTWRVWRLLASRFRAGPFRESVYSVFGPLCLLSLFVTWVCGLILGFALLHWSLGTPLHGVDGAADMPTYIYLSGTTLFTLGYGDITPIGTMGRLLAVGESGLGLGFLAMMIGYLPVLYQASSRREVSISLLDARAGSPPNATQFLFRMARSRNLALLDPLLAEWERWSAELLESHLSYPVLSYYRSQHGNQSWLAALTAVLDSCALLLAGVEESDPYQAQLTFAMARHAAVDLALVLSVRPLRPTDDRLNSEMLALVRQQLRAAGMRLRDGEEVDRRLAMLRAAYEPFVNGLALHLRFELPPVVSPTQIADNWQRSAWMPRPPGIGSLAQAPDGDHFG
jgi:Ion channel